MSYTKRPDIALPSGETVVELDDGNLVAVQCPVARDPQSNATVFSAAARWIDASGAQRMDDAGHMVATAKTHSANAEQITALGANVIARECLYLVLGEPLTPDPEYPELNLMKFSTANIAQCSIRNAIASASVAAPDAGEVL
jgi:hypothetical protein